MLIVALLVAGGTVVQFQLSAIEKRLEDRLTFYHKDQERLEYRLNKLEGN